MVSTEIRVVENKKTRRGSRGKKGKKNAKKKLARRKNGDTQQVVGAAQAVIRRTYEPDISQSMGPKGPCRVKHREFLEDVKTTTALIYQVLFNGRLNPGDRGTFPWLSDIARKYEKYIPHMIRLFFASEQSTTEPGSVMLVTEYEATDAPPATKQAFLNCKGAVRCAPWQNCDFIADVKDLKQRSQYYVDSGQLTIDDIPVAGSQGLEDPRLNDIGIFFMAAQNCNANLPLGELWIEYDIELLTPQQGNEPDGCTFYANTASPTSSPDVIAAAPFGSKPKTSGKLDLNYDTSGGGVNSTWTFRDTGRYFVACDIDATAVAGTSFAVAAPVAGGQIPTFVSSMASTSIETTTASNSGTFYFAIDVPESGGRLTLSCSTLTAPSSANMSILSIPTGYIPL